MSVKMIRKNNINLFVNCTVGIKILLLSFSLLFFSFELRSKAKREQKVFLSKAQNRF
jgi:hypothetical protein